MHEENTGILATILNFFIDFWSGVFSIFDGVLEIVPEYFVAIVVYLCGAIFMLWGWSRISRSFPRMLRLTVGIVFFAILFTPTISEGANAALAPATFALLFGILTQEMPLVWANLASILFVIALSAIVIFCWNYYIEQQNKNSQS
ncbi:MAG: hypothetical protein Q4D05_00070 [Acinetobacter sp.]|nr:hypothetical protein [Acinetobacter sp.]